MCISLDLNGSKIHAIYLVEFLKINDMMQCKRCNKQNKSHDESQSI